MAPNPNLNPNHNPNLNLNHNPNLNPPSHNPNQRRTDGGARGANAPPWSLGGAKIKKKQ